MMWFQKESGMILTCAEMKTIEEAAFARGVPADALMEEAGAAMVRAILQFFPSPGHCVAYCGKGHNAGDALVVCRHLAELGWRVEAKLIFEEETLAPLTREKLTQFRAIPQKASFHRSNTTLLLDGLLGIGASGTPRSPLAEAIQEMNTLRREKHAVVIALDIPSGLHGDTGEPSQYCVQADFTLAVSHLKAGLLTDEATNHVGRLVLLPLKELAHEGPGARLSTANELRTWLPPRNFDSHKGVYGRVGVLAGSARYPGAARLCSAAAVHGGAGLVTLFVPENIHSLLAGVTIPEVMVRPIKNYREVLDEQLDALAVGPGLGFDHTDDVLAVIRDSPLPMVVDADALTMVAKAPGLLNRCAGDRLLTPHPGEMARLAPEMADFSRREIVERFTLRHPVTLLLKGARTVIGLNGEVRFYNATGHPGMGTGGMGDVLTGVCSALLGQGLDTEKAGVLGAWVCGRAAEIAVWNGTDSAQSLAAGTVCSLLGSAFQSLARGDD